MATRYNTEYYGIDKTLQREVEQNKSKIDKKSFTGEKLFREEKKTFYICALLTTHE